MPRPLLNFSQLDNLIQIIDTDSHTKWQTAADLGQLSSEANWSGSALFSKPGHSLVQKNKGSNHVSYLD